MSQTAYLQTMATAYLGGHGFLDRAITARNNSAGVLPYGSVVVFDTGAGTTDLAVKLPSAAGDVIMGVVLYDQSHETADASGVPVNGVCSLATTGEVWCFTEQAVTPNDPVFVRYNAAGGTGTSPAVGQVRKDADTAKAVAATNARFRTSAAAGGLVLVEFNLP